MPLLELDPNQVSKNGYGKVLLPVCQQMDVFYIQHHLSPKDHSKQKMQGPLFLPWHLDMKLCSQVSLYKAYHIYKHIHACSIHISMTCYMYMHIM